MAEPTQASQKVQYVTCFQKQDLTINGKTKAYVRQLDFTPEQDKTVDKNEAFRGTWAQAIPVMSMQMGKTIAWSYQEHPLHCNKDPQKALESLKKAATSTNSLFQTWEQLKARFQ